jgi:hypothetical protein
MMSYPSPTGPQYPLQTAVARIFSDMTIAVQHYVHYQYVRCLMYELSDGRVLMVVHA